MMIRLVRPELFALCLVNALVWVSGCASSSQQQVSLSGEQVEETAGRVVVAEEVVACRFFPKQWSTQAGALRVSADGPVFAQMPRSRLLAGSQMTLPVGERSRGAALQFTAQGVTYQVNYQTEEPLVLYSAKQREISPVMALGQHGSTRWESGEAGRAQVVIVRPEQVLGEDVRQTIACEELTLERDFVEFPEDPGMDVLDEGQVMVVPAGQEVPISAVPGGPVVETLLDAQREMGMIVLETEGDFLRVYRALGDVRIWGWAPAGVFEEPPPVRGGGGGMGQGAGGMGSSAVEPLLCAAEVPLSVRVEGEIYPVGRLHRGAAWIPGAVVEDQVEIELPRLSWLRLASNATYVLAAADAQACRTESL